MKHNISYKIKTISAAIAIACGVTLATTSFANTKNKALHIIDKDPASNATAKKTTTKKIAASKKITPEKAKPTKNTLNPKAVALIEKITHGQVKIGESFPAVNDMSGYIISAKQGPGQPMIVYVSNDGSYALFGNIVSADGTNLSQQYTQKYITSKMAIKAYQDIHKVHYITQGKDSAPHKMYIIMDPNCSYCHLLYMDLNKYVKSGKLQIRWIPVGFLRPNSKGKSAAILAGKDNATNLKELIKDETSFDMKTEQGGAKELDKSSKNLSTQKAFKEVAENNSFWQNHGFNGTPVILYKNLKGVPTQDPSTYVPKEAQQKALLKKAGNKW
jgi:thiol:disulfide interchange protein DsbG